MKKPIIVLAIQSLEGGGAERLLLTLAKWFEKQGCEVHIVLILRNQIEYEIDDNLKIHHFKQYYRWIPRTIRAKISALLLDKFIIKKCGYPDLVLSNLIVADRVLCHSKLNVYLLIHSAMSKEYKSLNTRLKNIYNKKPVVCVSDGVKRDFDKTFNSPYPSIVIHNFTDVDFVKQQSTRFCPMQKDYVVHAGRFSPEKRHDILIKAYHQSGINNPLLLIGKGKLKQQCKDLVNNLGLEKKVIFMGFQTNPYPFIKNAKLMVLSSDFEGFGLVITEALALGTPVISTDCQSGPAEILPKNNLTPVGDIDALANKIADAVQTPNKYKTDLKDEFLPENQIAKYLSLIEK